MVERERERERQRQREGDEHTYAPRHDRLNVHTAQASAPHTTVSIVGQGCIHSIGPSTAMRERWSVSHCDMSVPTRECRDQPCAKANISHTPLRGKKNKRSSYVGTRIEEACLCLGVGKRGGGGNTGMQICHQDLHMRSARLHR